MFSVGAERDDATSQPDAIFSSEMGTLLINSYFDVIHPQVPVLVYAEVLEAWNVLQQPPSNRRPSQREALLFMVFAIGARVSSLEGKQDASSSEAWGDYFFRKANNSLKSEDASLRLAHFFVLKVRPNNLEQLLDHRFQGERLSLRTDECLDRRCTTTKLCGLMKHILLSVTRRVLPMH